MRQHYRYLIPLSILAYIVLLTLSMITSDITEYSHTAITIHYIRYRCNLIIISTLITPFTAPTD
jgi:hypothetical protein